VDDEIAALIATTGTTLVSLMVTDTWQQARDGFVHLWRRHRPEAADRVERELDSSRTVVLMAQAQPLPPHDLGERWRQDLRDLLSAAPQADRELRELLAACMSSACTAPAAPSSPRVQAKASGHARAYAAGGNQTIFESS
jgi:hypothetical protein